MHGATGRIPGCGSSWGRGGGHGPGADLSLALELTNTFSLRRGRAIDELATPRKVAAWLAARRDRLGGRGTGEPSANDVHALRELLQTVLAAAASGRRPAEASIRRLNGVSSGAQQYLELGWPRRGEPRARVRARSRAPGAAALAAVARSVIELLGSPARQSLRRCAGPRCVLFFLAGDPRQTWCSEACGNRARMARYQAARRARRAALATSSNLRAAKRHEKRSSMEDLERGLGTPSAAGGARARQRERHDPVAAARAEPAVAARRDHHVLTRVAGQAVDHRGRLPARLASNLSRARGRSRRRRLGGNRPARRR
jgi:predicted RNA-binding Zn ribbon-like protein